MPKVSSTLKSGPIGKSTAIRTAIIAGVVVGIILLLLLSVIFISPLAFGKPYVVVYTANGEIFVGNASWFPRFSLTDVYIVQTGVALPDAPLGSNLQLVPLKDTPWSPKKLYFEEEQIVFYGPIEEGSSVAQALKNRQ